MFSKDIGIDLGTANILIYIKREGIVLNEPSVVAFNQNHEVLAVGIEAKKMLGRTPGDIIAIRPMKDGVIADFETTQIMLEYFLKKIKCNGWFSKPRILICCPSNITELEKSAIEEVALKSGARKVFIEEEPKVAAIGAGLDISKPSGNMVIDIGGGTTDIAVISLGSIVTSSSIKVAGNTFDADIIKYIKDKYNLLIGDRTAEEIKLNIGNVLGKENTKIIIKGRNLVKGLPGELYISSDEIKESLKDSISKIIQTTKQVLEQTPPELSADIYDKGIILTGGGSLLSGLNEAISKELKIPVYVAESPLTCVAEGTGIMLENLQLIDK